MNKKKNRKRIMAGFLLIILIAGNLANTFGITISGPRTVVAAAEMQIASSDIQNLDVIHILEEDLTEEERTEDVEAYIRHLGDGLTNKGKSEWTKYAPNYFYDRLESNEKALYDRLEEVCLALLTKDEDAVKRGDVYSTVMVPYEDLGITSEHAKIISWIFFFEEPQYYFLNSIVYSQAGEIGSVSSVGLGVYSDFANGEDRSRSTAIIKETFDKWVNEVEGYTGEREREKAAHDITCKNLVYEANDFDQGIAGVVFQDGKAVCAGYSKTYMMLCNAVGVETLNITSALHAWNLSNVEGDWYAVDCTWDDEEDGYNYKYFNKTDSEMMENDRQSSHLVESMWIGYKPSCEKVMPENPTVFYITYQLDGGKNARENPEKYREEDEVILKSPVREGYLFKGWYLEDGRRKKKISGADKKDYILTAKWEKISLKKVVIKKYKKNKKLLFLKKAENAKGYEVIYSSKRGFPKKAAIVKKSKDVKVKLKKADRKKIYYIKARAYAVDSAGKKIYGKYSKIYKTDG